ncbi:ATP-binding protein [Streptomyces sp. DH37]|uniref:ATP-binding protein n=1 Tax=Streptomyces sp. DH37 TaxID=3040122 RepID=UPI0024436278|nr:ATP-binding protein [Streptomyces sp. DH37]MDG9703345.1 ATP-binding protein [Streptomyces sp. DH37]
MTALALCLAGLLRLRGRIGELRERAAREHALAAARNAEVVRLASVRAPAVIERVRDGRGLDGVPGPALPPAETGEEFARALEAVVEALGSDEAVRRERALRDSVQAAFESVARNMHVMATVQQQVLDRVERFIKDPDLMAEVMKADHAAAQMTRKAQTLLVMCGIWPTRRESRPVSLFDCVRGAQSRIVEFGRVEVHGGQNLYVVPPAVEGLMHATAEILENATVFSPSRTQVVVSVREVAAGAVVEIDDAGLGMPPDVMEQALRQLRHGLDLTELGAVPRLGLACVGRWSRQLGFGVELTTASAYGGTRAVLFVPHRLLTEPIDREPASLATPAAEHARPREAVPAPERPEGREGRDRTERVGGAEARPGDEGPLTPNGLPRRRSRRRSPADPLSRPPGGHRAEAAGGPPPTSRAPWSPEAAGASVADIVSGARRGRAELESAPQTDEREEGR